MCEINVHFGYLLGSRAFWSRNGTGNESKFPGIQSCSVCSLTEQIKIDPWYPTPLTRYQGVLYTKPTPPVVHHVKGTNDLSTLAKDKGCFKSVTNSETPCRRVTTATLASLAIKLASLAHLSWITSGQ